jgi:uncharacterized protein (TIGR03089 family)
VPPTSLPPNAPTTFPDLLVAELGRDGSRPFVTFYDDATGERVELSLTTYANWVAKTASLLQDELDVERGSLLLVDLPCHWLGPVWLGAAWAVGATVTPDPARAAAAELVLCGPDGLETYAGRAGRVVATSLRPLGARFDRPLPEGVVDFGAVVWGQPDAFFPLDQPTGDDEAWAGPPALDQRALLTAARRHELATPGVRLLTDVDPCSSDGLLALVGPLLAGGGTVWVRHAEPGGWERRAETERATRVLRQPPRS